MDWESYLPYGIAGVAVLGGLWYASRQSGQTSTGYSVVNTDTGVATDPAQAANDQSIIAAKSNAFATLLSYEIESEKTAATKAINDAAIAADKAAKLAEIDAQKSAAMYAARATKTASRNAAIGTIAGVIAIIALSYESTARAMQRLHTYSHGGTV